MPDPARAARLPLYAAGVLLTASGLFHLGVWAARGGPWYGPLAWRKPILFGLSAGLTALLFRPREQASAVEVLHARAMEGVA